MRKNHSIRFNLTFYTTLGFAIFLAVILTSATIIYSTSISNIYNEQIITTSKQVVANYEAYFDSAIEVSNSLQTKIDNIDINSNKKSIEEYFDDIKKIKGEIIYISLYDLDGDYIVGNSSISNNLKENISENESFKEALNEPMLNIFSGVGFANNTYTFTLSRYVNYNREASHAIALIEFDFTEIVRTISQTDLGKNGHIVIFDRNYNIVYSSMPAYSDLDKKVTEELILGNSEVNFDNTSFNLYISTIANTGWKVSVFVNNSSLQAALIKFILIVSLITLALAVIYILIVILIVKQVTNPLSQLQVEMDKIKDLDYLTRKNTYLSGSKEIIQLNSTFNDMMVRIRDLTSKLVDERDAQRKSELKALQNQINPHFLYNTLDSIIFMIEKNENEKAEQMIVALSKFFRISISRGQNIIPLKDEIEHVKNYLLIQKIRFGDQFSYTINVEETLYKYYVIKLILQPIVENAIEHGLDEYSNDGKIEIDGKEDEEFIILSVKDNGFGISEEKLKEIEDSFHDKNIHKGVGLQNVYQRIKIYYGEKADIKINSVIDEGTTIFIYIPKRKALNNDEDKV